MTRSRAKTIVANTRRGKHSKRASQLLDAKSKQVGRSRSFVVMRFGDPRKWKAIPKGTAPSLSRGGRRFHSKKTYDTAVGLERKCALENPVTGKVIRADSIAEFCRKSGLDKKDKTARFHITPVLNGQRPSFKGWYCVEFLDRVVNLKDIYSNVLQTSVRDFIKREGKKGGCGILRMLNGKSRSIMDGRVMLAETDTNAFLTPNLVRTTEVRLSNGDRTFVGRTVNDVALKAGLSQPGRNLYQCAYGFRERSGKWRIKSIKTERKRIL